jgi:hypothetical protein
MATALLTLGFITQTGGIGASTVAFIGAGVSAGISSYQRKKQKKAASRAQAQARKAQSMALRRLQQQQQKIKAANFEVPFLSQADNTLMIRNPIASRRMVYGRTRIGGVWVFYEKTGASGEYRHLILALSEGPCEEIEGIYFDDTLVTLGADGNATGTYAGYARVMKHLGDAVASEITGTFTWASGATLDCVAHGLSDGDHVRLATYAGTGLATSTSYIVLNKTDDTFQLALYATPTTPITASAGGTFQRYIADGYAVSECANWTETHRLNGICYIYVRLKNNLDLFPNVIPQISVVMKGKADIEDPRTGTASYSTNSALCLSHYLQEPILGPGIDTYDIHPDELINAANTCDENVLTATIANFTSTFASDLITSAGHGLADGNILFLTGTDLPDPLAEDAAYYVIDATTDTFKLSEDLGGTAVTLTHDGTPTHTWRLSEKRYSTNGVLQLANDVEDNRNALASPMGGTAVYTNGYWVISAAEYFTPTFLIDEDMIVGEIELRNEIPRRDRFNLIKGTYVAEENNWQPFGFPAVTNAQYLADDGGKTIMQEVQFPFTTSPATAQRIAKLTLERSRRGVSLQLNCSLRAFPVQAGKTCLVSISRYGFARKVFEVTSTSFSIDDGKPTIEVSLRETDADIYNWDYSEEVPVNIPASLIKPGTKVADVVASPVAGSGYSFPLAITLTTATAGAIIRYSTTATPSTISSGTEYTAAFNVGDGDTVYAKAFLTGYQSSDAFSATYTT